MPQQNKNKLLIFSISLSLVSIVITLVINIEIAKGYLHADRKTQLWFGLSEWLQFGYQYYVSILGAATIVLALFSINNNIQLKKTILALSLSAISILIIFLRIWRLFV